jgi:SAM-dependent methyltransferase
MNDREIRRRQLETWDRVAASMSDFSSAPSTAYYRAREIDLIRRAAGPLQGKRVLKLDLWNEAINTRILSWVSGEGARTFGIDLSHVVAHRARANARDEHFDVSIVRADIRDLPFLDGSFDVVYTMGTIEHIDEYPAALREIHRVLRLGGTAIIGVPNFWDPFLRPLIVAALELVGKYPYAPEKSFTWRELRREVEAAGLSVREMTGILAMPGVLRMLDLFLHVRMGLPKRWTSWFVRPFDAAEARFRWLDHIGYLATAIARKNR